jgi:hypothetical protein
MKCWNETFKKGPGRHKSVSFPAVRAQFSALPVRDQLQFLSWLFEGALSHCVSTSANTDTASVTRCISSQDVDMTYDCDQPAHTTNPLKRNSLLREKAYRGPWKKIVYW